MGSHLFRQTYLHSKYAQNALAHCKAYGVVICNGADMKDFRIHEEPDRKNTEGLESFVPIRARRLRPVYVSGIALVLAAALGAASFRAIPAGALTEQYSVAQQKLPSFAPLVKSVKAAVVSIRVRADVAENLTKSDEFPFDNNQNPFEGTPFEHYFKDRKFKQFRGIPHGRQLRVGQGSGFFISPDGYIVTNNHVSDHAVNLEVLTDDGNSYPAKVIGTDPKSDLSLLKVDGKNDFAHVKFAQKDAEVGDWVVAMGNPFGLGGTVTAGIVSARGRNIGTSPYDDFIQIDAPVNKGNSGGPTFNQDGEVVGVNTAIYSPSGGSVGIAFAIPSHTVQRVVAQLKESGHVTRGWLGVQIQKVTPEIADSLGLKSVSGALITAAQSGSPAEKAGLKASDVITAVNGAEVKDVSDLARKIADLAPGNEVKLTVQRSGRTETITVKIGELPDKQASKTEKEPGSKSGMRRLGIEVAPASDVAGSDATGLAVVSVEPGSSAEKAGISEGDIIMKVGDTSISRADDLRRALTDAGNAGKKHAIALVKRDGNQRFVALPTSAAG
jgi:serine protease Do